MVERARQAGGVIHGVRRMVRLAGAAVGRRAWVGKEPRRLRILKMEDILAELDCEVVEGGEEWSASRCYEVPGGGTWDHSGCDVHKLMALKDCG